MTTQLDVNHYQKGLDLVSAGKHQEGLICIREHLRAVPDDPQALNDAGAILHCLGRTEDAIGCLVKARRFRMDSAEIVWNLVEAYLAGGRAVEASSLFDHMEQMGILSIEVLNRTATMLLDQGQKGQAIEILLRSCRLWPDQAVLRPMLDVIRSKRPKVAFFRAGAGEDGVLADICEFVQERFATKFHQDLGGIPGTIQDRRDGTDSDARSEGVADLVRWSDIAWFDGGGPMAVEASRLGADARLIVSLRRSDLSGRWIRDIRWENVGILVQIGSSAVEEALAEQVPDIRNRTRLVVVPNGIDLRRYALRRREHGKNLACIGCLTMHANPAFLVQCMQKLHYIDPEYKLFFAGTFENPLLEQYIRHMVRTLNLTDVISFESSHGELNHWLSDKHYIVASGIGENQVEAVLAGMACGLKPIVHNFPGSEKLFPPQSLFNIAEQFCGVALAREYEPEQYRRFVEQRYPIQEQLNRVNGVLQQLENEIGSNVECGSREISCGSPSLAASQNVRRITT